MRDATSPLRATPLSWIKDRLSLMFGLDLRALALFRIFYGLTVIGDLLDRAQDLEAHYTDMGVIPRWWVLRHYDRPQYINVHAMSGAYTFQAALFFIHGCFAFCFMIGYKTKLFQFLTWLLTISLQLHNPVVGHGGDVYFRVMLLFSLFLPLEQLYSVDKFLEDRNKPPRDPERLPPSNNGQHPYWVASLATAAFVGQAMCMYIASVYHKTGQEWTTTYTSTYYALQLDYFRTAIGDLFLLGGNSAFLKFMTWAVYQWEYWGAWLLISPIFPQFSRALGAVGFMALHIGFGSCLRLGLFAFCTTFAAAAMIPSFVWDFVFHHLWLKKVSGPARPNLSYDSTNQFSTTVARAVNDFLLFGSAKMSPIGDTLTKMESGDAQPTETYSEPASHWLQAEFRGSRSSNVDAVTAALQFSTLTAIPALITKKLVPSKWQVRLRQRFGGYLMQQYTTSPKVPNTKKTFQRQSFFRSVTQKYFGVSIAFREILAFLLILFVLSWNLGNANSSYGPPPSIRPLGWVLRVDQSWGMFSPHPPKGVWWHVIRATLTNDSVVEIFKHEGLFRWEPSGPVTNDDDLYSPPNPFYASYGNHRWFKFWENGFNANTEDIRLNTGRWICRQWNSRHNGGSRLWQFQIILVQDSVHEDGSRSRAGHWEQWSHQCYDSKPVN